tara:strand:- start:68 stop:274 length:207 start_codon:yes stop_codon:yes gene_type:complete
MLLAIAMSFGEIPRLIYLYKLFRFITGCSFISDTIDDRVTLLSAINILVFSHVLSFTVTIAIVFITHE